MRTIDPSTEVCTQFERHAVRTGAANEELLAVTAKRREEHRRRWQGIIDEKLVEWGRDPEELADDDLVPPSHAAVDSAVQEAQVWRDARESDDEFVPLPQWVVPNGDGGIVFEWREGSIARVIEILDDGSVDCAIFEDNKLVSRTPIDE